MYYFDNITLQQYLDTKSKLYVYVDREWYQIADISDLQDEVDGIGYDVHGQEHRFDYRAVEQIKVGNKIFTLDQLNAQFGNKSPDKQEKPKSEPSSEEEPAIDEEPPEKEPQKAHYDPYLIGSMILKEWQRSKNVRN